MTSVSDFFKGFVIMVVFGLVGLMLIFCNGLFIDYVMDAFLVSGVDAGAGTAWDSNSQVNFLINVSYFIGIALIVVGIAACGVTIVKSTRYDDYEVEYQGEYDYEF